ncbi:MAG: 23S rRNA (uracil(1939)-C(5))-methyltransferase RlmD [Desulfuromonadales bacterium]|nr:23S rRNA (uracil(1939)-C(5))-methyltransferase RlmD [Desulfuromonadales bacterium]
MPPVTRPRPPKKPASRQSEPLTLTITAINQDGLGMAEHQGKPVLVFDALPGEQLLCRTEHAGQRRIVATTSRLLKPAAERLRRPICPHHRQCQGCALLSWGYPAQLAFKRQRVATALAPYPALTGVRLHDVWPAEQTLGYRASAKLVVASRRGRGLVGLYRRGSHDVVDIGDCPLHHPLINAIAAVVRTELERGSLTAYDPRHDRGLLRYLLVRVSPQLDKAMVTFVARERNYRELTRLAKWLQRKIPQVVSVHQNVNASSGNVILGRETSRLLGLPDLIDQVGEVRLRLGPTSFLQVNHAQAARIYALVRDWCRLRADQAVLDLYCGVGGISLHLAGQARTVLGVETVAEAVRHAQANAAMNGFSNCQFVAGNVEDLLEGELSLPDNLGAVVMNPPRSGCDPRVLAAIAALRPPTLVYVSCHPDSLARDLDLLSRSGYRLVEVQPVDMFPQTPHVECVARLILGS